MDERLGENSVFERALMGSIYESFPRDCRYVAHRNQTLPLMSFLFRGRIISTARDNEDGCFQHFTPKDFTL